MQRRHSRASGGGDGLQMGQGRGVLTVHARHFFKHNDRRRQDLGRVIRSLAYQLASCFPELQVRYRSGTV